MKLTQNIDENTAYKCESEKGKKTANKYKTPPAHRSQFYKFFFSVLLYMFCVTIYKTWNLMRVLYLIAVNCSCRENECGKWDRKTMDAYINDEIFFFGSFGSIVPHCSHVQPDNHTNYIFARKMFFVIIIIIAFFLSLPSLALALFLPAFFYKFSVYFSYLILLHSDGQPNNEATLHNNNNNEFYYKMLCKFNFSLVITKNVDDSSAEL